MELALRSLLIFLAVFTLWHSEFSEARFLTEVCLLPVDEGSPCDDTTQPSQKQYCFSRDLEKCVAFNYTGCGGNRNRFKGWDDCTDSCQIDWFYKTNKKNGTDTAHKKVPEDCRDPLERGKCLAMVTQWYYNDKTSACESFVFGGCGGSKNRFDTEDQCKWVCIEKKTY